MKTILSNEQLIKSTVIVSNIITKLKKFSNFDTIIYLTLNKYKYSMQYKNIIKRFTIKTDYKTLTKILCNIKKNLK